MFVRYLLLHESIRPVAVLLGHIVRVVRRDAAVVEPETGRPKHSQVSSGYLEIDNVLVDFRQRHRDIRSLFPRRTLT